MPTPIREAVLASVAARLTAQLAGVTILRARRAPVEDRELPAIVVFGADMTPDETQSPTETFWTIGFELRGHAAAPPGTPSDAQDLAAEQAITDLHARAVAALQAYDLGPATVQATAADTQFALDDAEESSRPAATFSAAFTALAITPTSNPYV